MPIISARKLASLGVHPEYAHVARRVGDLSVHDFTDYDTGALMADINEVGINTPLVICREESGETWLRDGHHRAAVALHLGIEEIPVTIDG